MGEIRTAIEAGTFAEFVAQFARMREQNRDGQTPDL
jgi:queuine/archaeosine tRNA-ribosyltransferase